MKPRADDPRRQAAPSRVAPWGEARSASGGPRASWIWLAWLLAAVAIGVALRLYQADTQILTDDEWHALHRMLKVPLLDIVLRLGYADYSIPLTLYYRYLWQHGGLSEWSMHVPLLVSGIALLGVVPWLARRWADLPTRALWVALLAISPLLVYHSKIARPYALTSLLTAIAIIGLWEWWHTRRWRYAAAYFTATFLAGYLHPVTLPFTLTPLLYFGLPAMASVLRGRATLRTSRLPALVLLGLATAALLALALLPPMINDWSQFGAKAGRDVVTPESVFRTLLMLAGTGNAIVGSVVLVVAGIGCVRLARRHGALARYLALILVVGGVAVALTRAKWIMHPLVLARYLLPGLPFLLLLVAEGISGIVERIASGSARAALALLLVAALVAGGPLPVVAHYPNQFWNHLRYQFDYDDAHNPYVTNTPQAPIPAFYRELATRPPGSVTLIEAPWRLESDFNPHPWYQRVHRQWIKIGLVTPVCGVRDFGEYPETIPGMRMRGLVHLTAVLRGETFGADYLVLHLAPWKTPPDAEVEWPDMSTCLPAIEARFGAPVYREGDMRVYALPR